MAHHLIIIINLHCRWLKTLNITLASENKQRVLAKTITGDNVVAELGAFSFHLPGGGEEIRQVPFVYVRNLIAKVADMISSYERYILANYRINMFQISLQL